MKQFIQKIETLKQKNRYRSLALPNGIDLTSNDYLGMAGHPALRQAAIDYLQGGGPIGAGGSRLLRGHMDAHAALEGFAAAHFDAPKTLYFASGFQANTAIFQSLPNRHDTIIFDELIHASARDGIQNSHAAKIKVPHNNATAIEDALKKARETTKGQIWIAVESLYSMDGDIAPLAELMTLANQYGAMLIVDEAHATGVMGENGKGLMFDLYEDWPENLITLHTCGKAIGVAGGLICASKTIIDILINTARGFIYSTAPMPLQAHLVQKSLELIASSEGDTRRKNLQTLCKLAQEKLDGHGTHIVPLILGDDEKAVETAYALQHKSYDIRAIRPPTVPEGTARLRLSLSAALNQDILKRFIVDFQKCG